MAGAWNNVGKSAPVPGTPAMARIAVSCPLPARISCPIDSFEQLFDRHSDVSQHNTLYDALLGPVAGTPGALLLLVRKRRMMRPSSLCPS